LNLSETTIRRWLKEDKIPAYRINHQYRFNRNEIEAWVMKQRLGTQSDAPAKENQSPAGQGGSKQFSLYRALNKGGVIYNCPGNTKEEIIRTAMRKIAKDLDIDAEAMTELLLDRENLQSTGLGNGIALPHTRDYLLNNYQDAVVTCFPEKPIHYDALDGKPVHTLFFLFACDDKRHLHLLAKIAHLSALPETNGLLHGKPSKESLLEHVRSWESVCPG